MEWKEVRLGDVCEIYGRIGFRGYTTNDLVDTPKEGAISLSPKNIINGELNLDQCTYIKWDKYYESPEIMINPNEIIITKTGSSVGRTTFVRRVVHPMTLNPQLVVLKNISENAEFLSYYIKSALFQSVLKSIVVGSAIPTLSQKNLANLIINVPKEVAYQRRIAFILSSLDRKIELNNKINADLEEMAQAIFKNWFVDFEPFKDGKFVDSELGMIPEGWKVGRADDFYQINIGKTPPRKEHKWFSTNPADKIWVSIANMGNSGIFISDSSEYLTKEAVDSYNIIMVPRNTTLLSFKLTVGRVAIADKELTTNEAIARFILSDDKYMEYLYLYLKNFDYNSLGSTSSIATAVNSKTIKGMQMLQPSDKIIDAFHIQVNPIFEKIRSLTKENSRLSLLRDTLLPRLMSGELEVPE